MEFLIGASAAVSACIFTNPLEVLKTRMQLQGELKAKGQHAVYYKNVLHAGYVVAKNDGLLALQKGLVPAIWVQVFLNGMRFGFYQFISARGLMTDKNGDIILWRNIVTAGTGGVMGQIMSNPFFLVKTQLQSQSVKKIAVGHQHHHTGMMTALREIFVRHGVKGLSRGMVASIPRAFVGATAQLTSFVYMKLFLSRYDYFNERPFAKLFTSSMMGGIAISVMINPFDLILTRIQNQPVDAGGKGLLYKNYMDCVFKIYKTEGLSAFYKGIGPMYFRLGPHSVLCLIFWDEFKALSDKYLGK